MNVVRSVPVLKSVQNAPVVIFFERRRWSSALTDPFMIGLLRGTRQTASPFLAVYVFDSRPLSGGSGPVETRRVEGYTGAWPRCVSLCSTERRPTCRVCRECVGGKFGMPLLTLEVSTTLLVRSTCRLAFGSVSPSPVLVLQRASRCR